MTQPPMMPDQSSPAKTRRGDASAHLIQVARCPIVGECLSTANPTHPCAPVVLSQWKGHSVEERVTTWERFHQLPEPWVGHLGRARILFVASNPDRGGSPPADPQSAASKPHFVTSDWEDDQIIDRYENAFSDYMDDGARTTGASASTPYWVWVKRRATELLPGKAVDPGSDYALTEVVRCRSKTQREGHVWKAVSTCAGLYLRGTLELSEASVLVAVGEIAAETLAEYLQLDDTTGVQGTMIGKRPVLVTFLAHPASSLGPKTFKGLAEGDLKRLQVALAT